MANSNSQSEQVMLKQLPISQSYEFRLISKQLSKSRLWEQFLKLWGLWLPGLQKKDCQHCHCPGCKAGWVHRVQAGSAPERGEHKNKNTNKKRYPKDVWRCPPKGGELPRHRATATTRRVRDDPQGGLRECPQAGRQLGKNVPKPVNSDKYDSYLCRWRNSSAPKSHERSAPR